MKKNLTRILLLAVIVTSCYSLRFAAYGKYIDYMNDYSSVTVDSFCFSSSDLTDDTVETKHNISAFNQYDITLTFDIRNYENFYYFNEEGKDIYYYVQAEVYTDADFKVPSTAGYTTEISYGNGTESEAAQVKGLRRDNGPKTTYQGDEIYNPVACLKGMKDNQYVKSNGFNPTKVRIIWDAQVQDTQYVRILATVIPPYKHAVLKEIHGRFGGPKPTAYAKEVGIFDKTIDAKYVLNIGGGGGSSELVGSITRQSTNDYAITYTIVNPGEFPMDAKIYFKPERLIPDSSLEPIIIEEDSGLSYVESKKTILEKGSEDFSFYKRQSRFDTITDYEGGDIYLKSIKQAE